MVNEIWRCRSSTACLFQYMKGCIYRESLRRASFLEWNKGKGVWEGHVRVIKDVINAANAASKPGASQHDLSIWLRYYKEEVKEPLEGVTIGIIPSWLTGSLVRNGPGALTVGNYSFKHVFDGSATLHRFSINNGKASYQSRLIRTKTLERNQAAQRIVVSEFGTRRVPDPCRTIFQRFASFFELEEHSDNCNVSVYPFGDEVYAFTETPHIHRINPNNLETLGSTDISKLVNIVHHTSHPHVEANGVVCNVGLSPQPSGPEYAVFQFPNTHHSVRDRVKDVFAEAKIVAKVRSRWPFHPGYMHTFGVTDNYYVIVEQPMTVSLPAKIASNFNKKPLYKMLKWYEDYPVIIHVISRMTGESSYSFIAEPFFYFHIINQYEDSNHIVIDICAYKDINMIDCMLIESIKAAKENPDYAKLFRGRPVRYVLPLKPTKSKGKNLISLENTRAQAYEGDNGEVFVIPEILCDIGCELPRLNYPKFLGKKYKYFYAISSDYDLKNPGTLIKVDLQNKTKATWSEEGIYPSEPIFVPSPNQKDEDDGVILSSLLWANDDTKVAVVVLNARDLTEWGRTVFKAPGPVPKCLHGWYFPQV